MVTAETVYESMALEVHTEPKQIATLAVDSMTVLDSVSAATQRDYRRALREFLLWLHQSEQPAFNKAAVTKYVATLREEGKSAQNVNQRLCAIRRLASEAADAGHLRMDAAQGIRNVKGLHMEGIRTGNWLTKKQAQDLLDSPDISTVKGIRDRAILCVLIGCGLRRTEAAHLTFEHVQMRDNRWCIVDMVGKRNRKRTVPMPAWAKNAIDSWAEAADISSGRIFRRVNKGSRITGETMTDQAIADVVRAYAPKGIAAHDLRRTFAKLAHKGAAGLEQIQLSLGHSSIGTTERYLGVQQDLTDAPCDHLGLKG